MLKYSVVLVPFPFDDFSSIKVRPALCLTNSIGNFDQVIIAFISSKIPNETIESDVLMLKSHENFNTTGLTIDSVIRLHKIVTIPKQLIKRQLGEIDSKVIVEIKKKIKNIYELD
jgi:mRNA interferase MazF